MKSIVVLSAALVAGLAACQSRPAVLSDVAEDGVVVQSGLGTSEGAIANEAQRGCALYGKRAKAISFTCQDAYCLAASHLFACIDD